MNRAVTEDDWIEQLASSSLESAGVVRQRCGERFGEAYDQLRKLVPTIRRPLSQLQPRLGPAIAREYLQFQKKQPETLSVDGFLQAMQLTDLMLTSACLENDAGAWNYLQQTLDDYVKPRLRNVWAGRASESSVEEALNDVAAHCFQQFKTGAQAGAMRLAGYRGRASLKKWLLTVADRLLRERLRSNRSLAVDPHDVDKVERASMDSQPEIQSRTAQLRTKAPDFAQRLCGNLQQTLQNMPGRRRMAAVLRWIKGKRPSDVATMMKVSRPRISQLLAEAENDLKLGTQSVCEEIAAETGRKVEQIQQLLHEQLSEFLSEPGGGESSPPVHGKPREES